MIGGAYLRDLPRVECVGQRFAELINPQAIILLTPRCSAVLPLLSAASTVDPFSSKRWTQSTWPFVIANINGVLREKEEWLRTAKQTDTWSAWLISI